MAAIPKMLAAPLGNCIAADAGCIGCCMAVSVAEAGPAPAAAGVGAMTRARVRRVTSSVDAVGAGFLGSSRRRATATMGVCAQGIGGRAFIYGPPFPGICTSNTATCHYLLCSIMTIPLNQTPYSLSLGYYDSIGVATPMNLVV